MRGPRSLAAIALAALALAAPPARTEEAPDRSASLPERLDAFQAEARSLESDLWTELRERSRGDPRWNQIRHVKVDRPFGAIRHLLPRIRSLSANPDASRELMDLAEREGAEAEAVHHLRRLAKMEEAARERALREGRPPRYAEAIGDLCPSEKTADGLAAAGRHKLWIVAADAEHFLIEAVPAARVSAHGLRLWIDEHGVVLAQSLLAEAPRAPLAELQAARRQGAPGPDPSIHEERVRALWQAMAALDDELRGEIEAKIGTSLPALRGEAPEEKRFSDAFEADLGLYRECREDLARGALDAAFYRAATPPPAGR